MLCIICDKEFLLHQGHGVEDLYSHAEAEHGLSREDYQKVDKYVLQGDGGGEEQPETEDLPEEQAPTLLCIVCESEFGKGDEERFWAHVSGEHGLSRVEYEKVDNLMEDGGGGEVEEKSEQLSMGVNQDSEEVPLVMEVEDGVDTPEGQFEPTPGVVSILRPPSEKRHGVSSSLNPERRTSNSITNGIMLVLPGQKQLSTEVAIDRTTARAPCDKSKFDVGNMLRTEDVTASLCTFKCHQSSNFQSGRMCVFSARTWSNMRDHLEEHKKGPHSDENGSLRSKAPDPSEFVTEAQFHFCLICNKKILQDKGILMEHVFHAHDLSIYDYRRWAKEKSSVEPQKPSRKRVNGYRQTPQPKIVIKDRVLVLEEGSNTMNKVPPAMLI